MKTILIAIMVSFIFITICSALGFDDIFGDFDGIDDIIDFDPEDPFSIKRFNVTCQNEDKSFRCKNKLDGLRLNNQRAFITVYRDLFLFKEVDAYYDGKCSAGTGIIRNTRECSVEECPYIKCS